MAKCIPYVYGKEANKKLINIIEETQRDNISSDGSLPR